MALGVGAIDLLLLHHLAHPLLERLQLEQQEQPLEDGNFHLFPADVALQRIAPPLRDGGRTAVVDQHLLEGLEIHLQIEAIVRIRGEDDMHLARVDAGEVALLEELGDLPHQPLAQRRALLRRERARGEQIAVWAERLVAVLQLEQPHRVGMPPPVVEVAHEAPHLHDVAVGPGARHRQAIHQRGPRHRQEFLALQGAGGVRVCRDQLDLLGGRGDGDCDHC